MFYKTYIATALMVMLTLVGMADSAVANTETMRASFYEEGEGCLGCKVYYDENGQPYHKMANGKRFNDNDPTVVAHRNWPIGTCALVTNPDNGETIPVVVQDRGPYHRDESGQYDRDLDLSKGAARELNMIGTGVKDLIVKRLNCS